MNDTKPQTPFEAIDIEVDTIKGDQVWLVFYRGEEDIDGAWLPLEIFPPDIKVRDQIQIIKVENPKE